MVPGKGQDPSEHQPQHQDELQGGLYTANYRLQLGRLLLKLKELELVSVGGEVSPHYQNSDKHQSRQEREEYEEEEDEENVGGLVITKTVIFRILEGEDMNQ